MKAEETRQITKLLQDAADGNGSAQAELYRVLNDELRACARNVMWDRVDPEVQPTVLVNQFYLKLDQAGVLSDKSFANRRAFYKYAGMTMQRLLVDHHRKRKTKDRVDVAEFDHVLVKFEETIGFDIERLGHALDALKAKSPKQHEVVMLKFFSGQTIAQMAETLELTPQAVESRWRLARARLYSMLKEQNLG